MTSPAMPRGKLASILWFPIFLAIVLPVTFEVVYHDPKPHHVPIAVVGSSSRANAVTGALRRAGAGGFVIHSTASPVVAAAEVRKRRLAAAYVIGPTSTLYVASGAAPLRARYIEGAIDATASRSGSGPPRINDLVPLASGDGGTGVFFFVFPLMMTGIITAIVLLQLPGWGLGRRVLTVAAAGAVAATAAYLTAVDLHVLPGKPLILLYAFALTQVYGLLMVGLQPWLNQFFLPVSMISALILSVPSSGGTVSPDMLPALFHDLSYVLPLAQTVSITRDVAYFHAAGIAQATLVLGAWAALTAAAIASAWWRQSRGARPTKDVDGISTRARHLSLVPTVVPPATLRRTS